HSEGDGGPGGGAAPADNVTSAVARTAKKDRTRVCMQLPKGRYDQTEDDDRRSDPATGPCTPAQSGPFRHELFEFRRVPCAAVSAGRKRARPAGIKFHAANGKNCRFGTLSATLPTKYS